MLPGLAAAAAAHRCSWSFLCRLRLHYRAAVLGSSDRQGECPAPAAESEEVGLEDPAEVGVRRLSSGSTPACPYPYPEPFESPPFQFIRLSPARGVS